MCWNWALWQLLRDSTGKSEPQLRAQRWPDSQTKVLHQAPATALSCNCPTISDTTLSFSEPRTSICKTHLREAVLKSTEQTLPSAWLVYSRRPFFVFSSPASHFGQHFSNSSNATNATISLLHAVMTDSWITKWTCPESQVFTGLYGLFFYFPGKERPRKHGWIGRNKMEPEHGILSPTLLTITVCTFGGLSFLSPSCAGSLWRLTSFCTCWAHAARRRPAGCGARSADLQRVGT